MLYNDWQKSAEQPASPSRGKHARWSSSAVSQSFIPPEEESRWIIAPVLLLCVLVTVLCGGAALNALGLASIYATPGQSLMQSESGIAPVGSDGETQYYAIDHSGVILEGADGLPATTNTVAGAVKGVWKGGTAASNHSRNGIKVEDDDPNTFYSPLRNRSITFDKNKISFLKTSQFEWGQGAYDNGERVFLWAATAEEPNGEKDLSELREAGDISGLQFRRNGSGQIEGVDQSTADKNANNARLRSENGIVFAGSLEAGEERTFGADEPAEGEYVVRIRYPDAAKMPGGERADVILTYRSVSLFSNMDFNGPGSLGVNADTCYLGIIRAGNLVGEARYGRNDEQAQISTDGDHWVWFAGNGDASVLGNGEGRAALSPLDNNIMQPFAVGLRVVCELSVVRSGGNPDVAADRVSGTVIFAVSGLDAAASLSSARNAFAEIADESLADLSDASIESVTVSEGAKSYALVPDGNFLAIDGSGEKGTADGLRFVATGSDGNTFDSGFAVLADTEGFMFEWEGFGGSQVANTQYRFW